MKIQVSIKDPDALFVAFNDAEEEMQESIARECPGLSADEVSTILKSRREAAEKQIAKQFVAYSEYYLIEFDTDAGTARVVSCDEEP